MTCKCTCITCKCTCILHVLHVHLHPKSQDSIIHTCSIISVGETWDITVHANIHVRTYIHVHVHVCIIINMFMRVYTICTDNTHTPHTHIHTHTRTHAHTYTHTYTHYCVSHYRLLDNNNISRLPTRGLEGLLNLQVL